MIVKFNPQRAEIQTTASVENNVLTYNNENISLDDIPNGATATNGYITIDKDLDGEVTVKMLWQYTDSTNVNCFPKDLEIVEGEIFPKESTK